jgi:hypothetical protein
MRGAMLGAFMVGLLAGVAPAGAQVPPPPSPEASEIAACLCLQQAIDVSRAESASKQAAYDSVHNELTRLDADLARERAQVDVNNPDSVARFRQLLEHRDSVFRRSSGQAVSEAQAAAGRYNRQIEEYNARCANRPRNPVLLSQVQATLSCRRPY